MLEEPEEEGVLTAESVLRHAQAQGLQPVVDVRFSHRHLELWLLKHQHGLRGGVDWQRACPLHRAVAPAGHAVAAPGVGKPEVLSALLEDGGAGGRATLGGAQQSTGAQQPQPSCGEVAGGDLELAGVAPSQSCPCRASCR